MSSSTQGTQVVGRVAAVLRVVSATMPDGATTTRIAEVAGLSRPTTHRLLSSLVEHGFVDRDAVTGRWLLGPELYVMGAIAAERYDITPIARESLRSLAAATGESAFLSARRGDETVCLLREEGAFPIRSHVLYEGIRFPLGVASAGMVMLAFLPDTAVDAHLSRVDLTVQYGQQHTPAAVHRRIAATRAAGYALNPGLLVEGSWGMAAAIFDVSGQPAWALSLTGIESRFTAERRPELGRLLLAEAHRVTQEIGGRARI